MKTGHICIVLSVRDVILFTFKINPADSLLLTMENWFLVEHYNNRNAYI